MLITAIVCALIMILGNVIVYILLGIVKIGYIHCLDFKTRASGYFGIYDNNKQRCYVLSHAYCGNKPF